MKKIDTSDRLVFPATERNRRAIFLALKPRLKHARRVLEIASGSGEHIAYLAPQFPQIIWLPSDIDPQHRKSIAAWTDQMDNVQSPLDLDATAHSWGNLKNLDLVFCSNMIHITPWSACLGLLSRSVEVLKPGGFLALYGPFMEDGKHNAPSNAQFDHSLKSRNLDWGIRDLSVITEIACQLELEFHEKINMPANNLTVFFRRKNKIN